MSDSPNTALRLRDAWPLSLRFTRLLLLLFTLLPGLPAWADYSVGRLVSVQGAANILTAGDTAPHLAQANEVLAEGDQVATSQASAVQLEFAGVQLSLGAGSVLVLTRVETDGFAAYLAQGSVAAGRTDDRLPASAALDGPQLHVSLDTAGRFRLDVGGTPPEERLTVWQGRASAEVDQRSLTLYAGQVLDWAPGEQDALTLTQAAGMDGLDLTVINALQAWRTFAGRPYLGPDWIGAAALDQQGNWLEVTSVGPLWVPFFLPAGWAPYRAGHWAWNGVWGWTWIDDLPWSYTTFHFGRWIWWNNRWAWSPQGRQPLFSAAAPCPAGLYLPPLPPGRRSPIVPRGGSLFASASIASRAGRGEGRTPPPIRPAWTVAPLSQAPLIQRVPNRPAPPREDDAPWRQRGEGGGREWRDGRDSQNAIGDRPERRPAGNPDRRWPSQAGAPVVQNATPANNGAPLPGPGTPAVGMALPGPGGMPMPGPGGASGANQHWPTGGMRPQPAATLQAPPALQSNPPAFTPTPVLTAPPALPRAMPVVPAPAAEPQARIQLAPPPPVSATPASAPQRVEPNRSEGPRGRRGNEDGADGGRPNGNGNGNAAGNGRGFNGLPGRDQR